MSGLYREEPLEEGQFSPWAGKFRVWDRVCKVGTGGCWESLEAGGERMMEKVRGKCRRYCPEFDDYDDDLLYE